MAAKKEVKFEENIKELENIINTLEGGEVSLDEMLNLFEEGIKRTKECAKQLKEAEQKVTVLVKGLNGELDEQPFDAE